MGGLIEYDRKVLPHKTMKIFQTKESESVPLTWLLRNMKIALIWEILILIWINLIHRPELIKRYS